MNRTKAERAMDEANAELRQVLSTYPTRRRALRLAEVRADNARRAVRIEREKGR